MGGGSGGTQDAKHVLDEIGQQVHKEVHDEAKKYIGELKGSLSQVSTNSETNSTQNPCTFDYAEHTTGAKDNTKPCGKDGKGEVSRFSKERDAKYDEKKIGCSNNEGACAPLRRLSLCNKNMINMVTNNNDSKAKHDLLADVCYAAKFEGESLIPYREQYDATYPGSANTMCTMLARSFADIGDIIRGTDLYIGNKKKSKKETERDKLENKLKDIFGKIYQELTRTSGKKNGNELQERYKDTTNFYKLREDWWNANRETVWKAITCSADSGNAYFHATCNDPERGGAQANHYCRCNDDNPSVDKQNVDPPTNLDYVPQYLRWFEEWAEDFCRKKNKKLKDAIDKCRVGVDQYGLQRYCDLNGYDCKKTKRGRNKYHWDYKCTGCFLSCSHFRTWIDNQKELFLKQKEKYTKEMEKYTNEATRSSSKKKRSAPEKYEGYESKFYKKIKEGKYGTVNDFLEKLNKEKECQNFSDKEGIIDFKNVNSDQNSGGDGNNKTFSHTEYCQACPLCGVEHKSGNVWERKEDMDKCPRIKLYRPTYPEQGTPINFLNSGDEEKEIERKLREFCESQNGNSGSSERGSDSKELYEEWKCYQFDQLTQDGQEGEKDTDYEEDVQNGSGLCILQNKKEKKKQKKEKENKSEKNTDEIQKTFNNFFNFWVVHMLKDSIYWKNKLEKCLKNGKRIKCENQKCNNDCGCFQRWVGQKEEEWTNIKKHFGNQGDIGQEEGILGKFSHDFILQGILDKDELSKSLQEAYGKPEDKEHIEKLLKEADGDVVGVNGGVRSKSGTTGPNGQNTTIDKLLNHEKGIVTKCKDCPKPEEDRGAGRALNTPKTSVVSEEDNSEHSDIDENEENADDEDVVEEIPEKDSTKDTETSSQPKDEGKPPCDIVKELFEKPDNKDLQDACSQKYGPKAPTNWKCIRTTNTNSDVATTRESSSKESRASRVARSLPDTDSGKDNGSICVPPRRRKLYVGPLSKWARDETKSKSLTSRNGDGDSSVQATQGSQEARASSGSSTETQTSESTSGSTPSLNEQNTVPTASQEPSDKLRNAFIESAVIETFFLWDRYKKEWQHKNRSPQDELGLGGGFVPLVSSSPPGQQELGRVGTPGLTGARGPLGDASELGPPDSLDALSELQSYAVRMPSGSSSNLIFNGEQGRSSQQPRLKLLSGSLSSDESDSVDPNDPASLRSGKIPPEFLRQMFYTIADYRDICIGNTPEGIDEVIVSGNDKTKDEGSGKVTMEEIKKAIDEFLKKQNSDKKQNRGKDPSQPSGKEQTSDKTRESLWGDFAQNIWHGMICALTYKESEAMGNQPLEQNEDIKRAFFGDKDNNPSGTHTTPNDGTYESTYHYKTVTLKDENSDGPKRSGPKTEPTKLKDFVERPPFFRYLEEWGENFCGTRKKMLEKVKDDCYKESGKTKQYSGYGEDCTQKLPNNNGTVPDLEGRSCAISCSSYRRWIERKKDEYGKQEKAYEQQKKYVTENTGAGRNNDDNGFCGKLEGDAASFLNRLKTGPCKINNDESEEDNKADTYIKFNEDKTFGHENYCDPCPEFKVKCKRNGKCSNSGGTEVNCNGGTITTANFEKMGKSAENVVMLVSDDSIKQFEDNGLKDACQNADIFKGIRKDEWKCHQVCGYVVCKSEQGNREKINAKEKDSTYIIQIRALMRLWLEYFFEDYKKIKHKISHCIKNDKESPCISGCKKKCKCVEAWITKKREEWTNIKKRFNEQYEIKDSNDYNFTSFLEGLITQIGAANDKDKFIKLSVFDKSCGCSAKANSEYNKDKDAIECMLDRLSKEEKKCKDNPQTCDESPTHVEDDDDDYEEETEVENTVEAPNICPPQQPSQQPEAEDGKCEEADNSVTKKDEDKDKKEDGSLPPQAEESGTPISTPTESNPEVKPPVLKPEEEAPPAPDSGGTTDQSPAKPAPEKPSKPKSSKRRITTPYVESPYLKPALVSNALMWSIGIGFTALSYWWLLKKKSKSSIDLLRVMEIPQNDYDMPTLKSTNRYIPYSGGIYRGKRYIYIEGDTDEEKYAFMSDTTDITSSESEYEEFDINDIYTPHAPKYKTLIEVVLEPSGKNTSTSDNTPPTSDTPPPITDEEWNQLKKDFISNMLQNEQNDIPNNNISATIPTNTNPNTLYFDKPKEKPFIMSIHDRNLLIGEEISYDMSTNSGNNDLYSDVDSTSGSRDSYSGTKDPYSGKNGPISGKNDTYSGTDLINDSLSGNQHIDIYDEILKRKENELFGTNHVKHTNTHSVASPTNSDPIHNQLNLFHKWLDRHRNMCEKWDTNNKVDILNHLKEEWENERHSGNIHPSDSNKTLNTDVSIQINMNDPKPINQFTNMDTNPDNFIKDTILNDLEKHREPYYDFYEDDIYYDVNDDKTSVNHINMNYNKMDNNNSDVLSKVQIEMNINNGELVKEKYPISDIWNI
ncbi:erythrocyte membrane protein 1, EMP1 [Plasmodium reichenowi]|uniref:Erythrocyte membrane protein 1, EMP1 n=1 Tax=Plasmodium reichenowi TaxID=5854 RepID=A0A060RMK1_PLARE|nr:erythrocyte membrane protein 1, EMP1 [Plasmodium reichenowi]